MIKINKQKNINYRRNLKANGLCYTPLYKAYQNAKNRCISTSGKDYPLYGGRGIEFKWKSFIEFYNDMYSGWKPGLTLERIDVNGDYCKENCRWATRKEQARNRTNNRLLRYSGQEKPLSAWAELIGVSPYILTNRLNRGWSITKAFSVPIRTYGN